MEHFQNQIEQNQFAQNQIQNIQQLPETFDKKIIDRIKDGTITDISQIKIFLKQCVWRGQYKSVKYILRMYPNIKTDERLCMYNPKKYKNHSKCVGLILDDAIQYNKKKDNKKKDNKKKIDIMNYLGYVCLEGHIDCLRMFFNIGIKPTILRKESLLSIHFNSYEINMDFVKFLVEVGGVDINIHEGYKSTVLSKCVSRFYNLGVLQKENIEEKIYLDLLFYLLEKGAKVDIKDHNGMYPIHDAIQSKNLKVVEVLLDYGSEDLLREDPELGTKLSVKEYAKEHGNKEIYKFIKEYINIPILKEVEDEGV